MSIGSVGIETSDDAAVLNAEGLRDRGKRRRRDRILEAARELLRQGPDHSFTIPELAARAEVSIPTVSNLIGNRDAIWAALADEAVGVVDFAALPHDDPQERAHAIMAGIADVLTSDKLVNRALIRDWAQSVRAMSLNPTEELIECFTAARDAGGVLEIGGPRRLGEVVATGLIGCLHQWGAGLITDTVLRRRLKDVVDVAFNSVRSP